MEQEDFEAEFNWYVRSYLPDGYSSSFVQDCRRLVEKKGLSVQDAILICKTSPADCLALLEKGFNVQEAVSICSRASSAVFLELLDHGFDRPDAERHAEVLKSQEAKKARAYVDILLLLRQEGGPHIEERAFLTLARKAVRLHERKRKGIPLQVAVQTAINEHIALSNIKR